TTTMMQDDMAAGKRPLGIGSGNARLDAAHPQSNQGICADAIASIEGIDRETLEALGLESQRRAAVAVAEGRFDRSLVPVTDDTGALVLEKD
ncbi:hypothetical protein ACHWGN_29050, partial [Klebsiella pneumoniae]